MPEFLKRFISALLHFFVGGNLFTMPHSRLFKGRDTIHWLPSGIR